MGVVNGCGLLIVFPGHAHYLLPDHGVLVTEGRVRASVCWGEGPEGDLLATPTHKTGINPISNIHRIKEWIGMYMYMYM